MKKSDQLKQQRASKLEELNTLIKTRNAENRSFSEDEVTQFETLEAEVRSLDESIQREEKIEAVEARAASMAGASGESKRETPEETETRKMKARYSIHKAVRSQLPNARPLDGVELEFHQEIQKRAKAAGISIQGIGVPDGREARATEQTVTQESGDYGGKLVAEDRREMIGTLRPSPIIESMGATYMRGLEGDVVFPLNKGGIDAAWEGEIDDSARYRNEYDTKTMKPKRLAATVAISLQNLMQSSIDLEQYTIKEMETMIAQKIDSAAISGASPGDNPVGILNTTGVNDISNTTAGSAPTWADIVKMETEVFVKNANAAKMAYLINPATRGFLKTTAHTTNQPHYLMGTANELNGYNVGVSNHMPKNLSKGGDTGILSAAIFGDWTQMVIGEWGWKDLTIDNISQKRKGLVEITINTFLDVLLKHPEAFSIVKTWKL